MIVSGSAVIGSDDPRSVIALLRTVVAEAIQKRSLDRWHVLFTVLTATLYLPVPAPHRCSQVERNQYRHFWVGGRGSRSQQGGASVEVWVDSQIQIGLMGGKLCGASRNPNFILFYSQSPSFSPESHLSIGTAISGEELILIHSVNIPEYCMWIIVCENMSYRNKMAQKSWFIHQKTILTHSLYKIIKSNHEIRFCTFKF